MNVLGDRLMKSVTGKRFRVAVSSRMDTIFLVMLLELTRSRITDTIKMNKHFCTASCESPRFQMLHMAYFVQNVQKYRRYKEFEIYVEVSTGTTISQEMLKQTINKNNIHVPVGVSQVSQPVVMILLINDCYVMSLVVIISRMNFMLYRNNFFADDNGLKLIGTPGTSTSFSSDAVVAAEDLNVC